MSTINFGDKTVDSRRKTITLDERNVLNIFCTENGKIYMRTASNILPCPQFSFEDLYSSSSIVDSYTIDKCKHQYKLISQVQMRRGDEIIDLLYACDICNKIIKNL